MQCKAPGSDLFVCPCAHGIPLLYLCEDVVPVCLGEAVPSQAVRKAVFQHSFGVNSRDFTEGQSTTWHLDRGVMMVTTTRSALEEQKVFLVLCSLDALASIPP